MPFNPKHSNTEITPEASSSRPLDTMEKVDAEHSENTRAHMAVVALPVAAQAEAGVFLSVDDPGSSELLLAKDGHTVLLPQPTDDSDDPLNWPWRKKHLILLTVAWGAFCSDFTSAAGSAPVILQAQEWHEKLGNVNQTNSINVLMMALGGLIWVPMTSVVGRAPVLFWTTVGGLAFSIGTALSPNFTVFYAMRALTGLFITSAQTISIAFIRDIFFLHERARKIGLWAVLYIASPSWGPLIGNFVLGGTNDWRNVFWVATGVCAIDLALITAFLDETWYNRDIALEDQPTRGRGIVGRLSRVIGVWELRHQRKYYSTVSGSFNRFALTLIKPTIFLILVSYMLCFAWSIGINITTAILFATPREAGGYGFSYNGVGYLYFSPIVGVALGEIFGHFFNDYVARRYIKKHHGVFEPEARLTTIYVSAIFMISGLVLLGQALSHHLSVGAVAMGWGMHSFGIMTMSVAVSAYVVDSYPLAAAEVSGWTNFARAIGGFSVGYFQQPWGALIGYDGSFGAQAGITAFAIVVVVLIHRYGHILRLKAEAFDHKHSRS